MSPLNETSKSTAATNKCLPEIVIDAKARREYIRGKFLGKGGYATCYEFVDKQTNEIYAGKIISKERLDTQRLKQSLQEEINIHKTLRHEHIVAFHSHFEDSDNVYIILELCSGRSLGDMLQFCNALSEAEVRCLLGQLLLALEYLAREQVIHRDLKPGNLLLTEDMQLKVADFGFAIRAQEGRLKMICGTLNYMAPEVLTRKEHSFKSEVWSVGCITYKMLVGSNPFKASSWLETVSRIKGNRYEFPPTVSPEARALVQWMLHPVPAERPSVEAILQHDFMTRGTYQ